MYNEKIRTTSSAENYNGVLKRKGTTNGGNFFKFASLIQNEELFKSAALEQLVYDIEGPPAKRQGSSDYARNKTISMLTKKLEENKISCTTFLELYVENASFFEKIEKISDYKSDSEDDTNTGLNNVEDDDFFGNCCVCQERSSKVMVLPCSHLKTCSECHLQMEALAIAELSSLRCAVCRTVVENSYEVFN